MPAAVPAVPDKTCSLRTSGRQEAMAGSPMNPRTAVLPSYKHSTALQIISGDLGLSCGSDSAPSC